MRCHALRRKRQTSSRVRVCRTGDNTDCKTQDTMGKSHATVDRVAELLLGAQSVIARLPQDLQARPSVSALSNTLCTILSLQSLPTCFEKGTW